MNIAWWWIDDGQALSTILRPFGSWPAAIIDDWGWMGWPRAIDAGGHLVGLVEGGNNALVAWAAGAEEAGLLLGSGWV